METSLKKKVVEISKRLYMRGLVAGAGGNVSAFMRNSGEILITPSGVCKGYLTPKDIVKIDTNGNVISGKLRPTSEFSMHIVIYKIREDVNAIVHAHPPVSTGFACAGIALDYSIHPEMVAMVGKVPLVKYVTPTTKELAEVVSRYAISANALLLKNHGVVTLGANLEQAYQRMELLEDFAKIVLIAKLLGKPKALPKAEIKKILNLESEKYRLKLVKEKQSI
jgi:L-fuculose-phosphate aldolase